MIPVNPDISEVLNSDPKDSGTSSSLSRSAGTSNPTGGPPVGSEVNFPDNANPEIFLSHSDLGSFIKREICAALAGLKSKSNDDSNASSYPVGSADAGSNVPARVISEGRLPSVSQTSEPIQPTHDDTYQGEVEPPGSWEADGYYYYEEPQDSSQTQAFTNYPETPELLNWSGITPLTYVDEDMANFLNQEKPPQLFFPNKLHQVAALRT